MYGYVLQDWTTMKGAGNSPANFIQNEASWMGFSSFQDIVFWVDVREVTPPAAGTLTLNLQTCPTKDDVLFQTMTNCSLGITAPATPYLTTGALPRVILASNPAVPLSTWVRWALTPSTNAAWDISFRILASANRVTAAASW